MAKKRKFQYTHLKKIIALHHEDKKIFMKLNQE